MKHILRQFLRRDAHPAIQFIKYGMAGAIATVVDVGAFYLLSIGLIPALQPDDRLIVALAGLYEAMAQHIPFVAEWSWLNDMLHIEVARIDEHVRERHFVINRSVVFVLSNFTAYILNRIFVFTPGRHAVQLEIALFFGVSTVSFLIGTGMGWGLIVWFGISTTDAYVANLVAAVLINYVCRKFLVFRA